MIKTLLQIATLSLMVSCTTKPFVELSNKSPYTIQVKDFQWSFGRGDTAKFTGDFQTLNHKVFDLLKGKEGIFDVEIEISKLNKYGNLVSQFANVGRIDLNELNKYAKWQFWNNDIGIEKLLYCHYILVAPTDTGKIDTNWSPNKTYKVYSFTEDDLNSAYKRIDHNKRIPVNGVIDNVHFSFNNGTCGGWMTVDYVGGSYTVNFNHVDVSTVIDNRLREALKPGNIIKSYCSPAAGAMDLTTAAIVSK